VSSITSVRWVGLDALVSRSMALLTFVFVGRILGPEMMGAVAVIFLVKELANIISDFGLSQAIIHFPNPSGRQLATLYTLNYFLGFLTFCAAVMFAEPVAAFFGQPRLAEYIPIVGFVFLLEPIGQQVNTLLQKSMDFRTLTTISIVSTGVGAAVSISGVYAGFGVWALVVSGLVSSGVKQIGYLAVARRRKLLHGFALDFGGCSGLLSFGVYRTGASVLNFVNSRVDQLIIGSTLGGMSLGLYSMATSWTLMVMQQMNGIATKVAFPAISRIQDDRVRVRLAYLRLVNRVCTVTAAIFISLAVVAEPFVDLILGPDWSQLVPVIQLMCGYVLLRSLGNLNGPLAMGLGKANWSFYWNLGLVVVVPGVLLFATRTYNSLEVLVMALIGLQLGLAMLMYVYWTRRLIGPCLKDYVKAVAVPWMCGVVMGGAIHIVLQLTVFFDPAIQITVSLLIGGGAFIGASWLFNRDALHELIVMLFSRDNMAPRVTKGTVGH
jgi:O-antigen/teichoic acid export membrane protein